MQLRIKFFLTGVVFPAACFICAACGMTPTVDSPWQSGTLPNYVAMMLQWPGFAPFLPFVLFSAVCLAIFTIRPGFGCRPWVQFGLFTGVLLSLQFISMVFITSDFFTLFGAVFVAPGLAILVWGSTWLLSKVHRFGIRHVMILTTGCAVLAAALVATDAWRSMENVTTFFVGIGLYIVIAAPTLNLITYTRAAIRVMRFAPESRELTKPMLGTVVAWLIGWAGSWTIAVEIMMREYAKLPMTDPNCYVSSAAAHGHGTLVGSERHNNGGSVNLQMQRLKFLEFAMAAAFPRVHSRIRRTYNVVGPPMAYVCAANVWFADATYLSLKPIEWSAEGLRRCTKIPANAIRRIYR